MSYPYSSQRDNRNSFQRNHLPHPDEYYQSQGLKLIGRGVWRSALCPFHEDRRPSLRINLSHGCFRCMACGVYGGDVLAFHMKRYGLSFIEAAQALGAWKGSR